MVLVPESSSRALIPAVATSAAATSATATILMWVVTPQVNIEWFIAGSSGCYTARK
jgi:phosphate/sulfate permease